MPKIYQPGVCIDHYQVIELLGSGAANHVYRACDLHSQQEVVLKFPCDDLVGGAAIFACYRREAELGKYLTYSGFQQHLNQEEERSQDYLVLEYMQGRTLRSIMQRSHPALLPLEQVLEITRVLGETVSFLHKKGVIHQDLKPENIMLLDAGGIKVFDFGIAQWSRERRMGWRIFPSPVGTPDYMAPERLEGRAGSESSDVYAVGVILYELLCGRTPFQEEDGFAVLSQHISHDPPGILEFNSAILPSLATVVMRAIRRNPRKRYNSMFLLLHDLYRLDEVVPEDYRPDAPRIGGRYRQIIRVVLIIVLIVLMIVALGLFAQFHHAVRAG